MKPLLVGEVNPLSRDPRHALYPYPPGCSGARLQELVLGVSMRDYLQDYDRADLCVGKWSRQEARRAAADLLHGRIGTLVLLGAKVAAAFGEGFHPFTVTDRPYGIKLVTLPHPSGRNRAWQQPGAFERARDTLRRAGVLTDDAPERVERATGELLRATREAR